MKAPAEGTAAAERAFDFANDKPVAPKHAKEKRQLDRPKLPPWFRNPLVLAGAGAAAVALVFAAWLVIKITYKTNDREFKAELQAGGPDPEAASKLGVPPAPPPAGPSRDSAKSDAPTGESSNTSGPPGEDAALSVVGIWDSTFEDGNTAILIFTPDHTAVSDHGWHGTWELKGRKLIATQTDPLPGERPERWEIELNPNGRSMAGTNEKGFSGRSERRPGPEPPSVVGKWAGTFPNGDRSVFEFNEDGTVHGTNGFHGRWDQTGRTVIAIQTGLPPNKPVGAWAGNIDPTGKAMALKNEMARYSANYERLPAREQVPPAGAQPNDSDPTKPIPHGEGADKAKPAAPDTIIAPERSEWEGKQQQEGIKAGRVERISSAVKLVITERKEKSFKAEYTQDDAGVLELAGTISKDGKMEWDVKRIIKGEDKFSKDLVGGLVGTGVLKGKKMSLKWTLKGTTQRGKVELELKD